MTIINKIEDSERREAKTAEELYRTRNIERLISRGSWSHLEDGMEI